jgi:hypothetical protein
MPDRLPSSEALANGQPGPVGGSSQFATDFKEAAKLGIGMGQGTGIDNNGSVLKASGNRVMDDMAIKGAGSRSLGISLLRGTDGRSADTSALMSPVKSTKKKKLGSKGSNSAKSRLSGN